MQPEAQSFLAGAGWADADAKPIAQDASTRRYMRLTRGAETAILMIAPPEERRAFDQFIAIADWLRSVGLSAPVVYLAAPSQGLMLLEDFGTGVMAALIAAEPERERGLYGETLCVLDHLAGLAPPDGLPVLDADQLVAQTGLMFDELPGVRPDDRQLWQAELTRVLRTDLVAGAVPALRDMHAENILWLPGRQGLARVGLLDFQDAVLAPPGYDLASLVDDPRRVVPQALRTQLIAAHAAALGWPAPRLSRQVALLSLARNVRILGIFRRAARLRARPAYLGYLPRTAALISRAAQEVPDMQSSVGWVLTRYDLAEGPAG